MGFTERTCGLRNEQTICYPYQPIQTGQHYSLKKVSSNLIRENTFVNTSTVMKPPQKYINEKANSLRFRKLLQVNNCPFEISVHSRSLNLFKQQEKSQSSAWKKSLPRSSSQNQFEIKYEQTQETKGMQYSRISLFKVSKTLRFIREWIEEYERNKSLNKVDEKSEDELMRRGTCQSTQKHQMYEQTLHI